MAIDRHRVGNFAMEALDNLAAHYDGRFEPADVEVRDVMLVVAFTRPDDSADADEGDSITDVFYYAEDEVAYHHIGLLRAATLAAEEGP